MQVRIPCAAIGAALAAAVPAAHAQTLVTQQPVLATQPVETVRTVTTTVRTVRPPVRRRVVEVRRTTVRERILPRTTTTIIAPAPRVAATYSRPVYDEVPPPVNYSRPVYDVVPPAPVPAPAPVVSYRYDRPIYDTVADPVTPAPFGTVTPTYRYVYQPDRILVIDPATGIAIQSIPR